MATIKPRRGTGVPSGLSQNELAVDSTNKRVYVGDAGGAGVVVASHITDYVSSLNGATGAITNVAKTDTAQTFTQLQQFVGLSAAGGTFISAVSGTTPLVVQYNSSSGSPGAIFTTAGQARIASLQLGRSAVTTYNTLIHNIDGLLSFYNGITTGANPLAQFSPSLGQTFSSSNGLMRVQKTQYVGGDSAVIRIVGANSLLIPPTTFNSDIVANSEAPANTTHTLPAITGTLLNTSSSYVSGICGATGSVSLVAGTNISITKSGSDFTIGTLFSSDIEVNGVDIGRGGGNNATNLAVGTDAFAANSSGTNCVAVGSYALDANTSGTQNLAVGAAALGANTSGGNNTALGYGALLVSSTQSTNTAIGTLALGVLGAIGGAADGNVAIGYQAGYNTNAGTNLASTGGVFIGSDSKALNTGGENEIVIGYQAVGKGSNTTTIGNSSTTQTFLYGRVDAENGISAGSDGITTSGPVTSDGGFRITSNAINTKTADHTLLSSDNGKVITLDSDSLLSLTVPSGLPVGFNCTVIQLGTGGVGITASGTTLNSFEGKLTMLGQHSAVSIVSYITNTFNVAGGLTG